VRVSTATADGLSDRVILKGFSQAPQAVLRDGIYAQASMWSFNAVAGTVALKESDGSKAHEWIVAP